MAFGLFRSKKQQSAADLLAEFVIYQQVLTRLERANRCKN
jgi:hypothetical protein